MDDILKYTRANFEWSSDSLWFNPTAGAWTKDNLFYVQETGRFRTFSGYLTERQNLESYLMVYTHRGKGKLTINDQENILEAGYFFWIDCRDKHVYQTCSDAGWDFDWVHFTGPGIDTYFDKYRVQKSGDYIRSNFSSDELTGLFDKMLMLQTTRGPSQELEASRVIYDLMIEAMLLVIRKSVPENKLHLSVAHAIDYMETNIGKRIKLDDIASSICIDKYYLIKLFKKQTGLTPFEWLQKARVSRAKELLILSDESIEEIARYVGLSPASYFISVFKSSEGLTPLRFRQRWKNPR